MGNDLTTVLKHAGVTSKIDINNAHYMVNNALCEIFKDEPIDYTIIAHGNCNILIKTHTVPEQYYRICFRAYIPEVTQRMIKTYNVLSQNDYGFLLPPEAHITDDYVYYRIELVKTLKTHLSYEEMYSMFQKVLPLAEHDLAWIDYKPGNLGIVDGKIVIIDFECLDEEDIKDTTRTVMKKFCINNTPEDIKQWIRTHKRQCNSMNPFHLVSLFAAVHGYMDPLRYMRLVFNYALFRRKNDFICTSYNDSIYKFMIETPLSLI